MTDAVGARGSLRSRSAALVSALTLRQIGAVLPPEQAWTPRCWWPMRATLAADIRAGGGSCEAMAHVARFIDTSLRTKDFDAGKAG